MAKAQRGNSLDLRFEFAKLASFLETVKVTAVQRDGLRVAQNALMKILKTVYGVDKSMVCFGVTPRWPPIG